ncbi:hypothetical protein EZS27_031698, partial [termite gut metagenome]
MLQSIELTNFKSIKKHRFPLRKLNLLLGLNGTGKSSFIQSLLLFRQSDITSKYKMEGVKSDTGIIINDYDTLKLNGDYVHIGTTKDARYQYCKKGACIGFTFQFNGDDGFVLECDYEFESDILNYRAFELPGFISGRKVSPPFFSNRLKKPEALFS